jgi:probable rRNA maturation factor
MIEIINRQRKHRIPKTAFRRLLERLADGSGLEDPDVNLVFVGERAIRTLNRTYRKKDAPTDVLSFPMGTRGPDGRYHLGDIVISVPVARAEARRNGRSLDREMGILAIHGFFHLLGHDHSPEMDRKERSAQRNYWR